MRANDLPGMADVDSSPLLFCRSVKKEATVALSGKAADEIFGGYPWFRDRDARSAVAFPWAKTAGERAALLAPGVAARIRPAEYAEARTRELFYLNITRFLPTLLDRKDRMSMASGLEVRVPYCDHRLVEYVWNVPWELKAAGGREKGVLREAMRGILPDDVLARRKSPYPKTHDPAYREAVRIRLNQALDDPSSPLLPLLDLPRVRGVAGAGGDTTAAGGAATPWFVQLMALPQLFAYLAQLPLRTEED